MKGDSYNCTKKKKIIAVAFLVLKIHSSNMIYILLGEWPSYTVLYASAKFLIVAFWTVFMARLCRYGVIVSDCLISLFDWLHGLSFLGDGPIVTKILS